MKRSILAFAVVLGGASAAWAASPAPLTTLRAIHALSNAEASQSLPVAFEATVTYFHATQYTLFVQDDGVGIFVVPPSGTKLVAGDRVLIRGKTAGSFHPIVLSDTIALLRHGALPKPEPATFDELIRIHHDCMMVSVRGVVRTTDMDSDSDIGTADLQLLTEGGYVSVSVDRYTAEKMDELLEAEVEITGVAGGQFDGKMQVRGIMLNVSSPAQVKILRPASTSPWSIPITPMDQVITAYHVADRTQRVRVHGTITYYQPGSAVVLQDGARSLWIATQTYNPMLVGDVVDATGFPEAHKGFLALTRAEIKDSRVQAPIAPLPTTRTELAASHHVIDLVSVEGQVLSAARGASQDEYGLTADGQLFSAVYSHPPSIRSPLPPMKQIPIGSRVRVSGICITENSNPYADKVAWDILMRSFDDIAIVAEPSLLNVRNLVLAVSLLLAVVIVEGGWGWTLRRKVGRQTATLAAMAQLEQRRGHILEKINGSDPLAEILEEIAGLVASTLNGAPCWCEIAGGATLGVRPADSEALRVIQMKVLGRSGSTLGTLFAGLDPLAPRFANEPEALSVGVRLASLAIETRRLYTDLRRRSEFDLLTEIHNRFSLEKYLDRQIEETRMSAGAFGLIYIDLDDFKQVNDHYGHHTGDLYLQEAAQRMKRQLRGGDILARLGGDEFAALVTVVRSRAEVETIVERLDHSFDDPFVVGGYLLRGAASFGIALYPEDGATRDSLLSAADATMYVAKHRKKNPEDVAASPPAPEVAQADRN
jgi:diguanylate cyclase (GGDEF)-like protein